MVDIAVYVQSKYANQAYKEESYNVRIWPGIELIKHVLVSIAGYEVDYCSAATVQDYKIILFSITSPLDWYSFIAERIKWKDAPYIIIVGGAGNLNIRPVLPFADIFVFGRGENIIAPLIAEVLHEGKYNHPSVAYADDFSPNNNYAIAQVDETFPHTVTLANGKEYQEIAVGCQRKCLFCNYTWSRKHIGGKQTDASAGDAAWGTATKELTFYDLDYDHPEDWPSNLIMGLEGVSFRLRQMVNKPITTKMWQKFIANHKNGKLKIYMLCGLPSEDSEDYQELYEDIKIGYKARQIEKGGFPIHFTPFKPMPATPAAIWPAQYENYRGTISKRTSNKKYSRSSVIFESDDNNFFVREGWTESLSTLALWMIMLRGLETDTEAIKAVSSSRKFWTSSAKVRQATIEKYFDVDKLFRAYTWDELPTRYLQTYIPQTGLAKLSNWERWC